MLYFLQVSYISDNVATELQCKVWLYSDLFLYVLLVLNHSDASCCIEARNDGLNLNFTTRILIIIVRLYNYLVYQFA